MAILSHNEDVYNEQGKELREHGTTAFPIAIYSGDWTEGSVQLHWHDELEAGFVTAGSVLMYVGKEKITLSKGDGFFINSGIPHAFLAADEEEAKQKSLVFDPILIGGRFDSVFWQQYVQPVATATAMPWFSFDRGISWHKDAIRAIESAWRCCQQKESEYELDVRHSLSHLIALLKRHLPAEQPTQARKISRDNERIKIMMQYIQDHFTEQMTTNEIAATAMISPSECLRCFHNTISLTPIQYTKYYRVQRAADQLQATDRKIADIGADCGFQEMSYFAKAFREIMGITPSEYRKKHQNTAL